MFCSIMLFLQNCQGFVQFCTRLIENNVILRHTDPSTCVFAAVWTAVTWAMTVMRPTLAAYPACPIAPPPCPGVTASPVPVCRPGMPHPQQAVDFRGARVLPHTQPTQCPPAAQAASAAHPGLSSSKISMLMTSSLGT